MPCGWPKMFRINLLAPPGLQGAGVEGDQGEVDSHEDAILNRLQARAKSETQQVLPPEKKKKPGRLAWLIVIVILIAAAYLLDQTGTWKWSELLPFLKAPTTAEIPQVSTPEAGSCATVIASFLTELPSPIVVRFLDAGGGVLIYRVEGDELNQPLQQFNSNVKGHQFSDLIVPSNATEPGIWLGIVAFNAKEQVGALRPVESEYVHFFNQLRNNVGQSGGEIVKTVPGTMTAGEYVLQGSLEVIKSHVVAIANDASGIHYHRVTLLKPDELIEGPYLLRVIFNLIEDQSLSQQLLSLESTGV